MDRLIYENLKLKEHIKQLKDKNPPSNIIQDFKEIEELKANVLYLQKENNSLRAQVALNQTDHKRNRQQLEELRIGMVHEISHMDDTLKILCKTSDSAPLISGNGLLHVFQEYTNRLCNQAVSQDDYCNKSKQFISQFHMQMKILETMLKEEGFEPDNNDPESKHSVGRLRLLINHISEIVKSKKRPQDVPSVQEIQQALNVFRKLHGGVKEEPPTLDNRPQKRIGGEEASHTQDNKKRRRDSRKTALPALIKKEESDPTPQRATRRKDSIDGSYFFVPN